MKPNPTILPPPHPSHPQTQDKHNNELPSPKFKLHVTSTNDRGKKTKQNKETVM